MLVLDSGGVSKLAKRTQEAEALIAVLRREGLWPPLVPSVVLVECVTGRPRTDVITNRFLKTCEVVEEVSEPLARRAASLRARARRGSAVDALVIASAEPGGTVLTGDTADLRTLAGHAEDISVEAV